MWVFSVQIYVHQDVVFFFGFFFWVFFLGGGGGFAIYAKGTTLVIFLDDKTLLK